MKAAAAAAPASGGGGGGAKPAAAEKEAEPAKPESDGEMSDMGDLFGGDDY